MRLIFLTTLILQTFASQELFGADTPSPQASQPQQTSPQFEYPELMVSPSASQRLLQSAKTERSDRFTQNWAIQSSALTTIFAAAMAGSDPGRGGSEDDDQPKAIHAARTTGFLIGGGWLTLTGVMSATYRPYHTASKEISGLPRSGKRELLAYERLAEEGLSRPSHISRVLKWTSFASNAAAGGFIASSAGNNSTKVFGGLASAMSLLPLLFEHEWEQNHNRQQDYKRRVYGPVTNNFGLGRNGQHLAGIWTGTVVF